MRHATRVRGSRGYVARLDLMDSLGAVIYAVRLEDGVIKIGWTRHFGQRLRFLKSHNQQDVELLGFKFASLEDEQAIHAALGSHRARGREYYRPTPEVLAVVNQMRRALDMAPLDA